MDLPINLAWFSGVFGLPEISGGPFHWYVFALPRRGQMGGDHYFICDYPQMREWVLDFAAPLVRDHRDQRMWRADLRVFPDDPAERSGYFRWGDEPVGSTALPGRVIEIDNVATLAERTLTTQHVGVSAPVASPRLIGV